MTKTSNLANFYGGENLWPESGWKPSDDDPSSAKASNTNTKNFTLTSECSTAQHHEDLLASLAPEYAEIDSLATFGGRKPSNLQGDNTDTTEAYATASVLTACKNKRNNVSVRSFLYMLYVT